MGDNGTAKKITSTFNGQSYEGGKGFATEAGTHVPCIFLGAQIAPGVDTSLICFEDFFVTLADLAGISSNGYGIQDGVSFYPQLIGAAGNPRPWIYNYYVPILQNPKDSNAIEWVQDYIYKVQLEDGKYSLRYVANDSNVVNPTDAEKQIRKSYKNIIANMH